VEVADELGSTYPFLANRGAISADDELLRGRGEVGQPADGEVFVIHAGVVVDGVISLAGKEKRVESVNRDNEIAILRIRFIAHCR
jgi:hypothetical protein